MTFRRCVDWVRNLPRLMSSMGTGFRWLAAVLILATAGQVFLLDKQITAGLVFYGAAGVLYVYLARRAGWVVAQTQYYAGGSLNWRMVLVSLASLGLVGMACYWVWQPSSTPAEDRRTLIFWLVGLFIFTAGVLRCSGWKLPGMRKVVQSWRHDGVILVALGALALLLRIIDLEQHPYAFANDEGWIGAEALRILSGEVTNFFRTGWSAQPNLSFVPAAFSITIFGKTIFAVRLVSAVEGVLTVMLTYLAGRELFGRRVAWMAAVMLAAMPVHIHFSRTGFNNILPGFYAVLLVWLTLRALRRGEISAYLWAGLATGSGLYAYLGCRLAMLLAAGILGWVALTQRGYLRSHLPHLLVFVGAAALVAAPMATFFVQDINLFMARVNAEGILQNGWLNHQIAAGRSVVAVMLDQLAGSVLVFLSIGGRAAFYNSPQPYLPALAALFGVLGMAYSLSNIRKVSHITLQAWFWSLILTAGILTANPPQHQRMVMDMPAAALLVALGLEQLIYIGARLRLGAPRLWQSLAVLVVAVTCIQGIYFYFGEYRANHYYADHSNEVTLESIFLGQQLNPRYRFVSLGAPEVYLDFANYRYLLNEYSRVEYKTENGGQVAGLVGAATPAFYFAIPERRSDLAQVAAGIPGGQWLELPSRTHAEQVLISAYVTPPVFPPLQQVVPNSLVPVLVSIFWMLLAVLLALLLEALFLPAILRKLLHKPVKAHDFSNLVARLRTWWNSALPELASAPPPLLEVTWFVPVRQWLADLQEPEPVLLEVVHMSQPEPAPTSIEVDWVISSGQNCEVVIDPEQTNPPAGVKMYPASQQPPTPSDI